jgi:phage tail sheath gpL-like
VTIAIDGIPVSLKLPGTYVQIDNSQAYRGLNGLPTRVLVIGEIHDGTPRNCVPTPVSSVGQIQSLAGAGTILAEAAAAVLQTCGGWVPVDIVAVEAGTDAAHAYGSIRIAGSATAPGTLVLYVAGRRVAVGVNFADTGATVAAAAITAINALPDCPAVAQSTVPTGFSAPLGLPSTSGVVWIGALQPGLLGNDISLTHSYYAGETVPSGLTVSIIAMTEGAGSPDITTMLDALGDAWYTDIVMPYRDPDNVNALKAKLASWFGPLVQHDSMAWLAHPGSWGIVAAFGDPAPGGSAYPPNSPALCTTSCYGVLNPSWEVAGTIAGVAAYYLSQDPARPLQTLPLPGLLAPVAGDRMTAAERNLLLNGAISTMMVNADGSLSIERMVTMYLTDVWGNADPSYLNVETMRTLACIRYDWRVYASRTFQRCKLADDDSPMGLTANVVTPKRYTSYAVARAKLWVLSGWLSDIDSFKAGARSERDTTDRSRINLVLPTTIIGQLRVQAALLQFFI